MRLSQVLEHGDLPAASRRQLVGEGDHFIGQRLGVLELAPGAVHRDQLKQRVDQAGVAGLEALPRY